MSDQQLRDMSLAMIGAHVKMLRADRWKIAGATVLSVVLVALNLWRALLVHLRGIAC